MSFVIWRQSHSKGSKFHAFDRHSALTSLCNRSDKLACGLPGVPREEECCRTCMRIIRKNELNEAYRKKHPLHRRPKENRKEPT